jgi:hypothetical protein
MFFILSFLEVELHLFYYYRVSVVTFPFMKRKNDKQKKYIKNGKGEKRKKK